MAREFTAFARRAKPLFDCIGAPADAVAGGGFEDANSFRNCTSGGIRRGGFLDFSDESGADNDGIREAAEDGDVSGQRDAEADGNR